MVDPFSFLISKLFMPLKSFSVDSETSSTLGVEKLKRNSFPVWIIAAFFKKLDFLFASIVCVNLICLAAKIKKT